MADAEGIVLDDLDLNDGTSYALLDLACPPPRQRQEWIGSADSEHDELTRTPLHENREITLKVAVAPRATMDLALAAVSALVTRLQRASAAPGGVPLLWTPSDSTKTTTFDVLAGEIVGMPINWESGWLAKSPELEIRLVAKPYWRGTETVTSTQTGSDPLVTAVITGVPGDVAALGRLIVTDAASQTRRFVEWGLEAPASYTAGAPLLLDSAANVVDDTAAAGTFQTRTGAYGTNVLRSPSLNAQIVSLCTIAPQVHRGTFRVKARVYSSAVTTRVRLAWQAGDSPVSINAWTSPHERGQFCEIDLGTVTLGTAKLGTQRWAGRVEVCGPAGGEVIDLDYLLLIPTSAGYGRARAAPEIGTQALFAADEFGGAGGGSVLDSRTASVGGSWATEGAGTDFTAVTAPDGRPAMFRNTLADSGLGRYAFLGAATVNTDASVWTFARAAGTAGENRAILARAADANNNVEVYVDFAAREFGVRVRVAGTIVASAIHTGIDTAGDAWYQLRVVVYASGNAYGFLTATSGAGYNLDRVELHHTSLKTGGTLASGQPGIRDYRNNAGGTDRYYTRFAAGTPTAEPFVVASGRSLQVRHDDTLRADAAGTTWGRPSSYRGTRFLVPTGTSRVVAHAHRNDLDVSNAEPIADSTTIQVAYTPRGLAVPS